MGCSTSDTRAKADLPTESTAHSPIVNMPQFFLVLHNLLVQLLVSLRDLARGDDDPWMPFLRVRAVVCEGCSFRGRGSFLTGAAAGLVMQKGRQFTTWPMLHTLSNRSRSLVTEEPPVSLCLPCMNSHPHPHSPLPPPPPLPLHHWSPPQALAHASFQHCPVFCKQQLRNRVINKLSVVH